VVAVLCSPQTKSALLLLALGHPKGTMGCCGEQREGSGVRQCTDVTFLGLFIVFVCLLVSANTLWAWCFDFSIPSHADINSTHQARYKNRKKITRVERGAFLISLVCFGQLFVAAFAIVYGNPLLLVYGYDSFGNICGKSNDEQPGGLLLSGLDMTHRPYALC
jgi:hypothetical protein